MRALLSRSVRPQVVEVPIALARLPAALAGFSIVQISDVHVGPTVGARFVRDVVERVNALEPDLVAITGDLVDGRAGVHGPGIEPLAELRSRHGTYYVTGNHEYYWGVDDWLPRFRDIGLNVLRNQRVAIERGGAALDLAGIDDHESRRWRGHGPALERALDGRDASRPVVLLAHQPRQVHTARRHRVDLQLSGHTHGGQIWPWHGAVRLQQGGLIAGHYRFGDTQLYVSRGTGYWGPPIRIGAPAEISRITLHPGVFAPA
jgi:predicted MPP superfamily phosphohydrolase